MRIGHFALNTRPLVLASGLLRTMPSQIADWIAAEIVAERFAPGQRLDAGRGRLVVACGEGALELLELQPAGGRRMAAAEWLRGQGAA